MALMDVAMAILPSLLLPVSFVWDVVSFWWIRIRYWLSNGWRDHDAKVRRVQAQVRKWRDEGDKRKMCTARPSWLSISGTFPIAYKDRMFKVQVHDLQDILGVDRDKMEVNVEPGITIGFLNRLLVAEGLSLAVVPEVDHLTVGGLVLGGGLESTSHKHGMFHQLVTEYELVTANGECVLASADENSDLFRVLPMSYGTFGFLTRLTIRVVPLLPWVRLRYQPSYSLDQTVHIFEQDTRKEVGNDTVEGIAFSRDTAVIMTGVFVNEEEVDWSRVNRMGLWYKPWFYHHVKTFLQTGDQIEYIPTLEFHQRHNKPCFWLTHRLLPWAHSPIARLLTGWLLPLNYQLMQLVKKIFAPKEVDDRFVVQDFILPIGHVKKAVQFCDEMTGVYPLWMVPTTIAEMPEKGIFVDLGIYGWSPLPTWAGKDPTLRMFEKFTLKHGGYQGLYADTLMSFEEFFQMFSEFGEAYAKVRARLPYCNEAFPTVYEKVSRAGRRGEAAVPASNGKTNYVACPICRESCHLDTVVAHIKTHVLQL